MSRREPAQLLEALRQEAMSKASLDMLREGMFRGVLKAAFMRSFEFASLLHRQKIDTTDETSFFVSAGLRGICEDLITLKFIRQLKRKERDEVVQIKMILSTGDALAKQARFFGKYRPFQPVLTNPFDPARLASAKDRLTALGMGSKLWNTSRKLPPVEQMASNVNLKAFYDYIYAATSEIVHFSVRIALRSGWGDIPRKVLFSTKNFCPYYLEFSQFFSLYTLIRFCRAFKDDLCFSRDFMEVLKEMRAALDDRLRWPEAVTFEEMNLENPNEIVRIVLKVAHLEKIEKRSRRHARATKK